MEKKILGISAIVFVALLGFGFVSAYGFGNQVSLEDKDAMRTAVESGDYASWKALMESQITEEKFNEIKLRHQEREEFRSLMEEARESGDYSQIEALREQYGLGNGMGKRNMNSGECPFADLE